MTHLCHRLTIARNSATSWHHVLTQEPWKTSHIETVIAKLLCVWLDTSVLAVLGSLKKERVRNKPCRYIFLCFPLFNFSFSFFKLETGGVKIAILLPQLLKS